MTLVGHWRLDGNPDNSIGDTTNTENGNPSYTSGKLGQSISLDGNGDYISVSGVRHVGIFGISAWVKTSNTGVNSIFSLWDDNGADKRYILFGVENGELRLSVENGTYDSNIIRGNTDIADGNWHHVASSYDGEVMKIYADGELENTLDVSVDIPETNIDWQIGAFSDGEDWNFTGEIDDVRLYDHAISQKEAQQLSQAKALHYRFDDFVDRDSSEQQNNGINNGVSSNSDSVIGSSSALFNGSSNYIGTDLYYNTTTVEEVTVSAWYKSSQQAQHVIASSDRNEYWRFGVGTDNVDGVQWTVQSSDRVSNSSASEIQDGNWHHLVAIFDASVTNDHKIYIDGELDTELNVFSSPIGTGKLRYTHIGVGSEASSINGSTGPDDWMDGNLDDVRVYNEALSQDEVQELYEQRASLDAEGSLYSHELDEDVDNGLSLFVESAGNDSSTGAISNILINGTEVGTDARGINAVEAERDGTTLRAQAFDVYSSPTTETNNLIDFINSSTSGNLLLFAEYDHAGNITDAGVTRFEELGSTLIQNVQDDGRSSWSFICQKGSGRLDETFAPSGNGPVVAEETLPDNQLIETTGVMSNEQNEVGSAPSSLVGWWPLDGNTRDYAGTSDGTNNGASISGGLGQTAYDFDGTAGIEAENSANSVFDELNQITLSAWIKTSISSTAGVQAIIHKQDGGNSGFRLTNENGTAEFGIYAEDNSNGYTEINSSNGIDTNNWILVTGVWDGSNMTLYLNTEQNATGTQSDMADSSFKLGIGANVENNGDYFNGKIQDVRIYDKALSQEEVTQLYNMTDPRQKQQVIQDETGIVQVKNKFDETL